MKIGQKNPESLNKSPESLGYEVFYEHDLSNLNFQGGYSTSRSRDNSINILCLKRKKNKFSPDKKISYISGLTRLISTQ